MFKVAPSLFLSSRPTAECPCCIKENDIRYILTVDVLPLTSLQNCELHSGSQNSVDDAVIERKHVYALDDAGQNILDILEKCLDFIDNGVELEESVLVHCFAGQSRSATIICAWLMRTRKLGYKETVQSIKSLKSDVCPNPGFAHQLILFEKMDFGVDKQSRIYQEFKVKEMQRSILGHHLGTEPLNVSKSSGSPNNSFKCRQCRRCILFSSMDVECHSKDDVKCSSHFLAVPKPWMEEEMGESTKGKLCCPKCKGKIGNFNWAGLTCSCGEWITPAFQIHKSKVDATYVKIQS